MIQELAPTIGLDMERTEKDPVEQRAMWHFGARRDWLLVCMLSWQSTGNLQR